MQTFLLDADYRKSAEYLDIRRRFSQIYEGIHILSSILDINQELVTPKRSVKNHPIAKAWKDYPEYLLHYIEEHFYVWRRNYGYTELAALNTINGQNIDLLRHYIKPSKTCIHPEGLPSAKEYWLILLEKDRAYYGRFSNIH